MKNEMNPTPAKEKWFGKQAANFENGRFGWTAILLTAQSCFGSVACMFIMQNSNNDVALAACAAVTMGSNAVFIAQSPGKWCLGTFYTSVATNTGLVLAYAL